MFMKAQNIHQEILLIATTSFSKRQWCKNDSPDTNNYHQSHLEQLEEICWNGLLAEILPEIIEPSPTGKKLCLWHIRQAEHFIQVELCDYPLPQEKHLSIDPYFFMEMVCFS